MGLVTAGAGEGRKASWRKWTCRGFRRKSETQDGRKRGFLTHPLEYPHFKMKLKVFLVSLTPRQ